MLPTGEIHDIAQPADFHGVLVVWRIHWLPDSTRFLADSVPMGMQPMIWQASVVGGTLSKFREDALAMSVSPDGSLLRHSSIVRAVCVEPRDRDAGFGAVGPMGRRLE